MNGEPRTAHVERKTNETSIVLDLKLEGSGRGSLHTGVPFLDHMLTLFAVHGLFDLNIEAHGDLEVDAHHTVEDIGICLGRALSLALSDRAGTHRYGSATVPMDEARASVFLDLSNRPFVVLTTPPLSARVGDFETELIPEFFRAVSQHGGITLHIDVPCGANTHHILEAVFKAWGRALAEAVRLDPRRAAVPSSKGVL
jgi:imidazoleglycerol-phosphate dehydratase